MNGRRSSDSFATSPSVASTMTPSGARRASHHGRQDLRPAARVDPGEIHASTLASVAGPYGTISLANASIWVSKASTLKRSPRGAGGGTASSCELLASQYHPSSQTDPREIRKCRGFATAPASFVAPRSGTSMMATVRVLERRRPCAADDTPSLRSGGGAVHLPAQAVTTTSRSSATSLLLQATPSSLAPLSEITIVREGLATSTSVPRSKTTRGRGHGGIAGGRRDGCRIRVRDAWRDVGGATSVGIDQRTAPSSARSGSTYWDPMSVSSPGSRFPMLAVNTLGRACSRSAAPCPAVTARRSAGTRPPLLHLAPRSAGRPRPPRTGSRRCGWVVGNVGSLDRLRLRVAVALSHRRHRVPGFHDLGAHFHAQQRHRRPMCRSAFDCVVIRSLWSIGGRIPRALDERDRGSDRTSTTFLTRLART